MMKLPEAARSVVEDTIHYDANVFLMRLFKQFVERMVPAQQWINSVIIIGMVTVISGRGKNRVEIESRNPQIPQIIEPFSNAVEIATFKSMHGGRRVPGLKSQIVIWVSCASCKTVRE